MLSTTVVLTHLLTFAIVSRTMAASSSNALYAPCAPPNTANFSDAQLVTLLLFDARNVHFDGFTDEDRVSAIKVNRATHQLREAIEKADATARKFRDTQQIMQELQENGQESRLELRMTGKSIAKRMATENSTQFHSTPGRTTARRNQIPQSSDTIAARRNRQAAQRRTCATRTAFTSAAARRLVRFG